MEAPVTGSDPMAMAQSILEPLSLGIHWLPWFWAIPVAILWCKDIQYSLYFPQCFLLNMTWHAEVYWKRKSLTGPVSMAEDTTKWTLAATIQAKTLAWVVCGDVWWIGLLAHSLWRSSKVYKCPVKTAWKDQFSGQLTLRFHNIPLHPKQFYQMRRVLIHLDTSWYYYAAVSVSGIWVLNFRGRKVNLRFDWMLPEAETTGVLKNVHSSAWLVHWRSPCHVLCGPKDQLSIYETVKTYTWMWYDVIWCDMMWYDVMNIYRKCMT